MGGINDFLFGKKDKMKKFPTMTREQYGLLNEMIGQLSGGYGQGLDVLRQYLDPQSSIYQNFEAPYRQEFEQQTVPMLAERFAGAGGGMGGGLSSSGFGQALSSAGSNLETNLAALKSQMQRNAIGDIFSQYQIALGQTPFGYQQRQGHEGFLPKLVGQLPGAIASYYAGGYTG